MSESGDFMILKDLIKSVVFDDVWNELNKEYSMKDRALEAYLRVFNQLKELMPGPNHDDFRLVVARVEDEFEPGTFIFGVLIENGTAEFASWMRSVRILDTLMTVQRKKKSYIISNLNG